jgi:hypothetical protein
MAELSEVGTGSAIVHSVLTVGDISFLLPINASTVVFSEKVLILHSFDDATAASNSWFRAPPVQPQRCYDDGSRSNENGLGFHFAVLENGL